MAATTRYREVADELHAAITGRREFMGVRLTPGSQLPTEPELGDHFGVGRNTVRRALQELAAQGLIETRRSQGTYVRDIPVLRHNLHREHPDRQDATPQATADTWFSEVREAGMTPSQDFAFRIVPATETVAAHLHVPVDDLVVVRECTRYVNDVPWSLQTSYYPYDIAKRCGLDTPRDIQEGTVRRMASCGIREDSWDDVIGSRPANVDETTLFALPPGVSVLVYDRVAAAAGRAVRYTHEILPADRNVVTITLADARPPGATAQGVIREAAEGDA